MSLFTCPNASRSLFRIALKGTTAAAALPRPFAPSRWISSCVRQGPMRPLQYVPASVKSRYPRECRRTFFSDRTIVKYEELPRDYRDQVGLPFRSVDLTDSEVLKIFGRGINSKRANQLLRILHGRRVAGTLDDPAFAVHTQQFTRDQMAKALEYLRKSVAVNEVLNAGLRAEDELAQMEVDMAEQEKKKGEAAVPEVEEAPKPDPIYGRSRFDEIRARNVAKRKAEEKLAEEEQQQALERGEVPAGPLAKLTGENREITNPKIQAYAEAAQSPLEAPPEMKLWERILPSVTVAVLVIGFLAAVSTVYEEPSAHFRVFPDISTAHATIGAIIALNALVYLGWSAPPLWRAFNKYMLVVVGTMKPVTLFTAQFSHQKLAHMLGNMIPLWFLGTALHEDLGRADFLTLYLACGAAGFLSSLVTYSLRGLLHVSTLGASGASLGVFAAYFWRHRNDGFQILGVPEDGVHGIVFLALLFVPQLAQFGKTVARRVDIASHVAGMLMGVVGVEVIARMRGEEREKKVFKIMPPQPYAQARDGGEGDVKEEDLKNS